jgi:phosphoglycerate dehydrogenase-like enzyme
MNRPIVLVNMSAQLFEQFLVPNLVESHWPFELMRCDPEAGIDNLLDEINRLQSAVLITGWGSLPLPETLFERSPSLKYICHTTGTIRSMIARSLIEKGLLVTNYGIQVGPTVAEHCLMMILASLRQATFYQLGMHAEGAWAENPPLPPRSLYGRKVGLHGFGANARALVKLLVPFECRISAYAPGDAEEALEELHIHRCTTLQQLFSENEILIELAPLIPETVGIVDEKLLQSIPEGGVFINCGRGAVIDEAALAKIARERKINFALDVYTQEPLPPNSPLRGLKNGFLTPHIAGPTQDHYSLLGRFALRNVSRYFAGLPLLARIDSYRYDHQT